MHYTPKAIVEKDFFFSIPIYQRLFEWDRENIETLLGDLFRSYQKTGDDYFIGLLTATEKGNDLVDGQQRFTVMMLLGCVLQKYDSRWHDFLFKGKVRLYFSARPLDAQYMLALINDKESTSSVKNEKMALGIKTIFNYFEAILKEETRTAFASYIYEHLSFFISRLPENYGALDLNKYFERMNSSGKNLEQHEILKVKLLRNLDGDISLYMQLWNLLADVDSPLISKREWRRGGKWESERESDLRYRKNLAFTASLDEILNSDIINGLKKLDTSENTSIGDIGMSDNRPSSGGRAFGESRCALRFPHLLLQTLYWMRPKDAEGKRQINESIEEFFDASKLLETFGAYIPFEGEGVSKSMILEFLTNLLHCRLALDICFVRPMDCGYTLDMNKPEGDNNVKELMMFESLLYVASSNYTNYRWFGWIMDAICAHGGIPDPRELFDFIQRETDKVYPLPSYEDLNYHTADRYWFWKLDFYIWQQRERIFVGDENADALSVAENYIFIRNRSLEHIAPQTPNQNSTMVWEEGNNDDDRLRDSFGNLVMISQGLNSALSNASYEVKTAHVQSFCNGAYGSIESLKLLVVHQTYKNDRKWDRLAIKEHGKKMYEWLQKALANKPVDAPIIEEGSQEEIKLTNK